MVHLFCRFCGLVYKPTPIIQPKKCQKFLAYKKKYNFFNNILNIGYGKVQKWGRVYFSTLSLFMHIIQEDVFEKYCY